ncbi:MAG: hypothetical protein HQL68_05830 [Magnetococcales bacterium]|nr:hypothetical protein [Magnetococcales bacterium]
MIITNLLQTIVDNLHSVMPDLQDCKTHKGRFVAADLKNLSARTPAIRVALLGIPKTDSDGAGRPYATLKLVAYIITANTRELSSEVAAINLVEALTVHLHDQNWGQINLGIPTNTHAQNLFSSSIGNTRVALWGVSWEQDIYLQSSVDEEGVLPQAVYLGIDPEIGSGHEDDYDEVVTDV